MILFNPSMYWQWIFLLVLWNNVLILHGHSLRLVVIGGGAAGYFSAIEAAKLLSQQRQQNNYNKKEYEVIVLEACKVPLSKVLISGGGRCNVMHDPNKGSVEISRGYPRGQRELLSPFKSQFGPSDTYTWFKEQGVQLKVESDGRVFPTTDKSTTIIETLESAAKKLKVKVLCNSAVSSMTHDNVTGIFEVKYSSTSSAAEESSQSDHKKHSQLIACDAVVIATGSSRIGHNILAKLGHSIVSPLPSLFSFKINDPELIALAGVSTRKSSVKLVISPEFSKGPHKSLVRASSLPVLTQQGPLLVTHQGLTGPAILRLSSFGARVLAAMEYKCHIEVNWISQLTRESVSEHLLASKLKFPNAQVGRGFPKIDLVESTEETSSSYISTNIASDEGEVGSISRRLWTYVLFRSGVSVDKKWTDLSSKDISAMTKEMTACSLQVSGRGVYRDEFVTCGGVSLKEINFSNMESKIVPNLYMAGEVLDIDGVTGGYNFQSAWTGGWIAGHSAGEALLNEL